MEARILIVTRFAELHELLVPFFRQHGFQVNTAPDGKSALLQFGLLHPELIVLDMALPQADGWETLQRIRELSDVPIVALTGTAEENNVACLRQGADCDVSRPFGVRELEARVCALLRRAQGKVRRPAEERPVPA